MVVTQGLSLNIIVIDDEPDICFVIGLELKTKGHVVKTFDSSVEALAFLEKSQHPDAVICDFKMPRKSGLDIFQFLKKNGYTNKFYLLTGELNMDQKVLEDQGITDIFYKPDDIIRIVDLLSPE